MVIRARRDFDLFFFFFNDTATTEIYTLSLHDALPILINGLLHQFGAGPVLFLADKNLALWSILAVLVWQAVGFYVVLFSAGMGSIPTEIYEAAALDGASRGTLFFKVTLPLLWNTLQVAWVYLGIAAFDAFAIVDVLTVEQGGPDHSTTVLAEEIYRNAFQNGKPAYASA